MSAGVSWKDGKTVINNAAEITGKTDLKNDLEVAENTLLKKNLTVNGKINGVTFPGGGGGGGVSDHGELTGLSDDDHAQYHNDARGDAKYAPITKGVTNGDTHDHVGGDGSQIDHGGLSGRGDDDHSQYHNDARGDARYALIAKGVTNGNYHDHNGGDGGQIDHSSLANKGTRTHSSIDTLLPSDGEKQAMAGTHGTPGSANKFVTNSDPRMGAGGILPAPHHETHERGGVDQMEIDAITTTGSLRTLGTGSRQASAGNHTHSNIGHTQNTDTGTTQTKFQVDSNNSGPVLKNQSGELGIRNSVDNAYAAIRADGFHNSGIIYGGGALESGNFVKICSDLAWNSWNIGYGCYVIDTNVPWNNTSYAIWCSVEIMLHHSSVTETISSMKVEFKANITGDPSFSTYWRDGNLSLSSVSLVKNIATGMVSIVIGDIATRFPSFLALAVSRAMITWGTDDTPYDFYFENWNAKRLTSLSAYDTANTVVCVDSSPGGTTEEYLPLTGGTLTGDLKTNYKIVLGDNYTRSYENVAVLGIGSSSTGAIVIDTAIPYNHSPMMSVQMNLDINHGTSGDALIGLIVSGCPTVSSVMARPFYALTGTIRNSVKWAKNISTGNLSLILGVINTSWEASLRLIVKSCMIGQSTPSDAWSDGWVISHSVVDLSGYSDLVSCIEKSGYVLVGEAEHNHDATYLKLSGGSMTGNIKSDSQIILGNSVLRSYHNLGIYNTTVGNTGAIVIDTAIPYNPNTTAISAKIVLDIDHKNSTDTLLEIVAACSANVSGSITRAWNASSGTIRNPVRWAKKTSSGNISLILGDINTVWGMSFRMVVKSCMLGFKAPGDSWAAGWTLTGGVTNLGAYDNLVTCTESSGYSLTGHVHTGVYEPANSNIQSHIGSTSNPHSVIASQLSLGSSDTPSFAGVTLGAGDFKSKIGTAALTATEGCRQWHSTRKVELMYDGQRDRALSPVGWVPFAMQYSCPANANLTGTDISLAADGGCVAVPILLNASMLLQSVYAKNQNTANPRTWNWALYEQYLNNGNAGENSLSRVCEGSAAETFTPIGASVRSIDVANAPVYLPPGLYWLVIQNQHATNLFVIGSVGGNALFSNGLAQTKTITNPFGSTLDFVASTWTKQNYLFGVVLNGRVFGQTTSW